MKKLLLSLALVAAAAFSATAQIRIEAGASFGNYLGNDNFVSKPGFSVGALYDITFARNGNRSEYLETGVKYVMKNAALKDDTDSKYNLSWLEIPVMAGTDLSISGNLGFYAKIGLFYAFDLTQVLKSGDVELDVLKKDSLLPRPLNRHDFGSIGQIGLKFGDFGVGVGYQYGFINLFNKKDLGSGKANSDCVEILLSYTF